MKDPYLVQNLFGISGLSIRWYAAIICLGLVAGLLVAYLMGRRRGYNFDMVLDLLLLALPICIIGARLYYVAFEWETYKNNLAEIFAIWHGGLAIYGAVIGGVIAAVVFCKWKKVPLGDVLDLGSLGLILGQAIGRWGNFVNCEVFGGYTDNLFAMQIRRSLADPAMVSQELLDHLVVKDGVEYIQVHPTFLYESVWDLCVFVILMWVFYKSLPSGSGSKAAGRKGLYRKKFDGEIMCLYFILYGIGRFVIEGIRVDQLMLFSTGIAVSQLLSAVMVIAAAGILVWKRREKKNV